MKFSTFAKPVVSSTDHYAIEEAEDKRIFVTERLYMLGRMDEIAFADYVSHCTKPDYKMSDNVAELISKTFSVLCSSEGKVNKEVQSIVSKAVAFKLGKPYLIDPELHSSLRPRM